MDYIGGPSLLKKSLPIRMRHYFKNDLLNLIVYADLRTKTLHEN
jgi:hypothetical protein